MLVRITSSVDDVHPGLLIVHLNVAEAPSPKPVIPDVGDPGVVILALPAITVQVPVPVAGVLPPSVKLPLLQLLRSPPAFAAVGVVLLVRITSSVETVHTPLEIDHLNVAEVPRGTPVTADVADPGDVTDAVPENTVHAPVPVTGVLPASVKAELLH